MSVSVALSPSHGMPPKPRCSRCGDTIKSKDAGRDVPPTYDEGGNKVPMSVLPPKAAAYAAERSAPFTGLLHKCMTSKGNCYYIVCKENLEERARSGTLTRYAAATSYQPPKPKKRKPGERPSLEDLTIDDLVDLPGSRRLKVRPDASDAEVVDEKHMGKAVELEAVEQPVAEQMQGTRLEPHILGGFANAARVAAARDATGVVAKAAPLTTFEERTDPSRRMNVSKLTNDERTHRNLRLRFTMQETQLTGEIAAKEAALTAANGAAEQVTRLGRELKALREQRTELDKYTALLGVFQLAGEILKEVGTVERGEACNTLYGVGVSCSPLPPLYIHIATLVVPLHCSLLAMKF